MKTFTTAVLVGAGLVLSSAAAFAAGPAMVPGPSAEPTCYVPWTQQTKFFQYPKKAGPYRIALANGFIGNTWRIQMIKTAKAYADQPEIKAKLKEFKVVSTGEDIAAQIASVNNFIDSGYDAIVIDAQNPTAFKGGGQAREGRRCRPGRLRQHDRYRRGHQRQRGPGGSRPLLGRLAGEDGPQRRPHPRGPRCQRHLRRHRPAQGHPGRAEGVGQALRDRRGGRQMG